MKEHSGFRDVTTTDTTIGLESASDDGSDDLLGSRDEWLREAARQWEALNLGMVFLKRQPRDLKVLFSYLPDDMTDFIFDVHKAIERLEGLTEALKVVRSQMLIAGASALLRQPSGSV